MIGSSRSILGGRNLVSEPHPCSRCNKEIVEGYSIDVWVSETIFLEEDYKTGEPLRRDNEVADDYYAFCPTCWQELIRARFETLGE